MIFATLFLLLTSVLSATVDNLVVVYDRIPSGETQGKVSILNIGGSVLGASINFDAPGDWAVTKSTCDSNFTFNPTSGTVGNKTVRVMAKSIASQTISAGQNQVTGSCSGTIDGTAFTINWLVRRARTAFVTDFDGKPDSEWSGGCSVSNSLHVYKNQCTPTTAYAPQDGVALPAAGSTITDPMFGGKALRCGGLSAQPYGNYSFSRDDSMYISPNGILSTTDCSVIASLPATSICGGYSTMYWDKHPLASGVSGFCHYDNTPFTVKAWHLSGGAVVDDGVIFTHTNDLQDHGSTGTTINMLGWAVFPSNGQFCIVNYRLGSSTLKCAAIKATSGARVRHVQISPWPDSDGILRAMYGDDAFGGGVEEYVFYELNIVADTWAMVSQLSRADGSWITFGDNWNADTGYTCTPGNTCLTYGHANIGWANGKSFIVGNPLQYQARSFIWGFQSCSLNNGSGDSCYQEELGGGGVARWFAHGAQYVVCAVGSPICGMGDYGTDTRPRKVTATESGGVCTGTVTGGNTFTTSQRVLVNDFDSAPGWNGYKTLSSSSGEVITWPCTGAGTSVIGYVVDATVLSAGSGDLRWGAVASRADNGHTRVLKKQTGLTSHNGDAYTDAILPQISTRGNILKINDSMGYPREGGISFYYTGFEGCTEKTKPNEFCGGGGLTITPVTDTTALATVTTSRVDGTCTLYWGTTIDYSGASSEVLEPGSLVRYHTIPSLAASTTYYANVKCDGLWRGVPKNNWDYAIYTFAQPASSPSGTVNLVATGGPAPVGTADMVLSYGATPTTVTVSCSATESCTAVGSVSRGTAVDYRLLWRNGSGVVLKESQLYKKVIQ